jgi:N-acylmannosamine kinase
VNRNALKGFAVDIGGTKTAVARIEQGKIVEHLETPTDGDADLEGHLERFTQQLGQVGYRSGELVGVAVTGRVTRSGKWFAVNSGTLRAIEGVPLGAVLKARFGEACCCNDAAAAAYSEAMFGAGENCPIFAYVTVSTGVGGGLVVDGKLIESSRGLAGHLGFVTGPGASLMCGSGRRGTVESVAAGRAIARAADDAGHPDFDARKVFEAARSGSHWADEIIDRSSQAIASLCADTAAALDPDCIAIGGSIGLADGYLSRVRAHLANEPELFRVPLLPAILGSDGPLLGALAFAVMRRHQ